MHTGFMGSSKACRSPCLTLQSRWCSISQTAGAGSILSMHSFAFAGHMLPGKRGFPQRREKQGKVVAGPRWQGWCSTLFFSHRAAQLLQPITHFIDATATRRHRPISRSGRQSNSLGFGSHSHYTEQGHPAASRRWDQAHPAKPGGNGQRIPKRARAALGVSWTWLAKQLGIAAASRERQPQTGHAIVLWQKWRWQCCPAA